MEEEELQVFRVLITQLKISNQEAYLMKIRISFCF